MSLLVILFLIAVLFGSAGSPAVAAIDYPYQEKVEELVERLKARGLSEEELARSFGDSRVALYPQIVERRGKGLNYRGREFGLLTKSRSGRG